MQMRAAPALDHVVALEVALKEARQQAGRALRADREALALNLRAAGKVTRVNFGMLSLLERAKSWRTRTALRVCRAYARYASKRAEAQADGQNLTGF